MGIFDQSDEPDDFDQQYDTKSEEKDEAVDRLVQGLTDEDIDDELSEAEKKLAKAAYYKVIVKSGVVEDDGSEASREVNSECRLWARHQMARLVGIQPSGQQVPQTPGPAAPGQFTSEQAEVLKAVADKLLTTQGKRPPEPAVKRVSAPPPPGRRAPIAKPQPPQVKRSAAPATKEQQRKPAGPEKPLRPKTDSKGNIDYDAIPTGKTFRDRDNHLYRFVPHPQEDNRRVKMKVTNQVRNAGMIPMPTSQAMEGISQAQSADAVNTGAAANTNYPDQQGGADVMVFAATGALRKQ